MIHAKPRDKRRRFRIPASPDIPGGIPCTQLVYCRSLEELERRAIGRFLALSGLPMLLVPSERPLPGRHFPNRLYDKFYTVELQLDTRC